MRMRAQYPYCVPLYYCPHIAISEIVYVTRDISNDLMNVSYWCIIFKCIIYFTARTHCYVFAELVWQHPIQSVCSKRLQSKTYYKKCYATMLCYYKKCFGATSYSQASRALFVLLLLDPSPLFCNLHSFWILLFSLSCVSFTKLVKLAHIDIELKWLVLKYNNFTGASWVNWQQLNSKSPRSWNKKCTELLQRIKILESMINDELREASQ